MGVFGHIFSVTGAIILQNEAGGFPEVHCCAQN